MVNLLEKTERLAKEFFKFQKIRKLTLHPVFKVMALLCTVPFMTLFVLCIGVLFVLSVLLELIKSPITFLHKITREEASDVKHATQAVIYWVSWPIVFGLYCVYAALFLEYVLLYFATQIFGYIGGLCGYKFHLLPFEEDISLNDDKIKEKGTKEIIMFIVYILMVAGLSVSAAIIFSNLYANYNEAAFFSEWLPYLIGIASGYLLFLSVYVPCAFRNKEKEQVLEKIEKKSEEK